MSRTPKKATAKKVKWTPPHVVHQQQKDRNTYYNKWNCQNSSFQKRYESPPSTSLSLPPIHTPNVPASHNSNRHSAKTHPTAKTSPTQPKPSYQQRKTDILAPLKDFVESLPSFLQASAQETALVLLNCSDELERRNEMVEFFQQDPSYIPISARFKYKLTSSDLLASDHIFIENAAKCDQVVDLAQKLLRQYTFTVVKRESWAARTHLHEKYIEHGLIMTQMLVLYEKFQFKMKYSNLPFPDGYMAKVALYNYIFADIDNISLYLDCSLESIITLLQTRLNLSQDMVSTKSTNSTTNSSTESNDNNPNNPYRSDTPTHSTTPTTPTTIDEPPSPSLTPESQSTMEHAQDQPTLPPTQTDSPPTQLHTSHSINNNTNCHINVTTNQDNNNSNISNITNTPSKTPATNPPTTTTHTSSTPKTRKTVTNPYARTYTYTSPNITTRNNTTSNRPSILTSPQQNNTITPNHHNQTPTKTNQPTNNSTQKQHTPPNNDTNTNTINELLRLFDQESYSQTISQPTDTQTSIDTNSQILLPSSNEPHMADITTETFPTCKNAYDLTTIVTKRLAEILPMLTYAFREEKQTIENEEEAATTALAWYNQLKLKNATEQVVQALDSQPTATPQTLQSLINDTVDQKMAKASPKLAKTIEQNLRKNSFGHPKAQSHMAKRTDSGLPTKNTTEDTCTIQSPDVSLLNTQRLTPNFTTLSNNSHKPPSNNSKTITWDDYLTAKQKKQQKMKQRFQRAKYKARK